MDTLSSIGYILSGIVVYNIAYSLRNVAEKKTSIETLQATFDVDLVESFDNTKLYGKLR